MAKLQNKTKDNPKLEQRPLKDGRISLYLEYYLGRTETPVVDEEGKPVLYTSGAMAGKPKVKITHNRKKETLPYYLIASPKTPAERQQNKTRRFLSWPRGCVMNVKKSSKRTSMATD